MSGQGSAPIDAESIREAAREVLARPEFRPGEPDLLERALAWLAEWIELPGVSGGLGPVVLWTLLALLGIGLGFALARVMRAHWPARRGSGAGWAAGDALAARVEELFRRGRAAREAGDRPLALRLYFFALVVGLSRRGELEYRDAWTNRELLQRGRPEPEVAARLAPLVEELDRKVYGREETTEADLERVEALARAWLAGGAAPGRRAA